MADKNIHLSNADWLEENNILRFSHKAMATIFEIFIAHQDPAYASQAADDAFKELDRLEEELSRFIENSDISRINNLAKNQSLIVGPDVFDCILACQELYNNTHGAFDISSGPLIQLWRDKNNYDEAEFKRQIENMVNDIGREKLEINTQTHEIKLLVDNIDLDLGGYGKGYALDRMAELLKEWSISIALLHGGKSSTLAMAPPEGEIGWPLSITHPNDHKRILKEFHLRSASFSGSGIQKGAHIINPSTGLPVTDRIAAWAYTESAALSDALSTAFMIMSENAIKEFCSNNPDIIAIVLFSDIHGEITKEIKIGPIDTLR
jgi:thiamine biosynthesis lipoprotein